MASIYNKIRQISLYTIYLILIIKDDDAVKQRWYKQANGHRN